MLASEVIPRNARIDEPRVTGKKRNVKHMFPASPIDKANFSNLDCHLKNIYSPIFKTKLHNKFSSELLKFPLIVLLHFVPSCHCSYGYLLHPEVHISREVPRAENNEHAKKGKLYPRNNPQALDIHWPPQIFEHLASLIAAAPAIYIYI